MHRRCVQKIGLDAWNRFGGRFGRAFGAGWGRGFDGSSAVADGSWDGRGEAWGAVVVAARDHGGTDWGAPGGFGWPISEGAGTPLQEWIYSIDDRASP